MTLTNDSEYLHLMTELKDNSLLTIILEAAINGEINLSVTVKRTFPARRAPSRLSLFLTDHKNAEASFGEFMRPQHPLYQNTVDQLLKSAIDTGKSDKKSFLYTPKELLPDYYDIYEFGPSDYIYINKDALITLCKKGVAYINSFICPPVSEQIIYDEQALYGTKLFEKNYKELPENGLLLELPHGALDISNDITNNDICDHVLCNNHNRITPRKSIAFYADERASFLIAREFKEIFPFTLNKLLHFIGADHNDVSLKLTYDHTKYDFYSILDKCSSKLRNMLSTDSMLQSSVVKLLSYVDKWAPLDIRDSNIDITLSDLYIAEPDLKALLEVLNLLPKENTKYTVPSQLNESRIKKAWLEASKSHINSNEKILEDLIYNYMILSAFANEQIFKDSDVNTSKSKTLSKINKSTGKTYDTLLKNEIFNIIRVRKGDTKREASDQQIVDKLYELATTPIDQYAKRLLKYPNKRK